MSDVARPLPTLRGEEQLFYDRLGDHELVYQRCAQCDRVVFPLRTVCPGCGHEELDLRRSEGKGALYSFTTQYRAAHPFFAAEVPYTLALADIDEGFRIFGSVPDPGGLAVGMRIEVVFDDIDDEFTLIRLQAATDGAQP